MPPKPETVDAILETVLPNGFARLDRGHGEIARGGMASIERVVDRSLGRQVALKLLRDELQSMPLAVRSFVREAQVMGQLDHPNIVPVHELALDEQGRLYFTMKLVEGRTLIDLLDELRADHQRLDDAGLKLGTSIEREDLLSMLDIFLKVLDAVAFAHARGVVHCDLKAENVMVGEFGQVYLMDWGIARLLVDELEGVVGRSEDSNRLRVRETLSQWRLDHTNMVMGTPGYMSPEQASGVRERIDTRSDIFGLGAMLYEILSGHAPYQGLKPAETLAQAEACKSVLQPYLKVPQELRRIVAMAMEAEPDKRYQRVEDLQRDLLGFMRGGDNFPRRRFSKGQYLIREGETGEAAFILTAGRCEVTKQINGKRESLRILEPGDVFGETAILASSPRTASVVALSEVVAVVVTADALELELEAMKPWMGAFIRALASRFTDVEKRALDKPGDPAQVLNLALMTLQTWGRVDPERGLHMSALKLCEQVAKLNGSSENAVLKILRRRSEFTVDLTDDLIGLADPKALAASISSAVWT